MKRALAKLRVAADWSAPVEYITAETDKDRVRRTARALLVRPVDRLADVRRAWTKELAA